MAPRATDRLAWIEFEGRPRTGRSRDKSSALSVRRFGPAAGARITSISEQPLDPFIEWVLARAGLDAGRYRTRPLSRRLQACLRALRAGSTTQAMMVLERNPGLLSKAVGVLLLGVTEFFRDQAVFDWLAAHLCHHRADRPLRVWSTACSNGAELYSVAMLLSEADRLDGSRLLGTDCRAEAIDQARRGLFEAGELKGLGPERLERFVRPAGSRARICAELREATSWEVLDLTRACAPGAWDILLWRNHAIYLLPEAASEIWRGLFEVLTPGGLLITGRAERPPGNLPVARLAPCVYQKAV